MPRVKRAYDSTNEENDSTASEELNITEQLETLGSLFKKLQKEIKGLKKENTKLHEELSIMKSAISKASPRKNDAATQLKRMENDLVIAKRDALKYKKRYQKIRAAELKRETRDLNDLSRPEGNHWEDRYTRMKKLLRRFRELVEDIVLEDPDDNEKYPDCLVCLEEMKPQTVAAFPCEHIFHMQCIRQLEAHARDLSKPLECPTCRKACEIDDIVNVSRTAGEQWKELTDVATEWAMMDGEPDEAETELTDPSTATSFIEGTDGASNTDQENEAIDQENEAVELSNERLTDESQNDEDSPPPTTRAGKRRRLEELTAARLAKKQKR